MQSFNAMTLVSANESIPPHIAALDIGTSSVRASLFDSRGRPVEGVQSQAIYRMSTTENGSVEIDPDYLVELACSCLDALHKSLSETLPAVELAAVAVSTFWHAMMGLGKDHHAATPLYSWNDTRAAAAAEQLRRYLDEAELHARTGCMIHASYWPAKLAWLKEDVPDLFGAITKWISPGDYLYLKLFGTVDSSVSLASATGLFNQNQCGWDQGLLSALEISPQRLPALAESNAHFVLSDERLRSRWPLFAEARWFRAIGDGACGNIGSGCTTHDRVAINVGTSGALRVLWEDRPMEIPAGLWCYRADRRRFVAGGALSNGGDLFAWARDQLRLPADEEVEERLGRIEPDSHRLAILPFWSGERSTGWASQARGAITGINLDTGSIQILRAMLEAVAYRFAAILDLVAKEIARPSLIVVSGAAATASSVWMQILCDVFGSKLLVSDYGEASSRGAALMALESLGVIANAGDAPPVSGKTYIPDPRNHDCYLEARHRQERLYESIVGKRL